jgi:hypothetical protein
MKYASRCRWGLPQPASRRLKSAWLTILAELDHLFAILFNGQKATLWVIPGLILAAGRKLGIGRRTGLNLHDITQNILSAR